MNTAIEQQINESARDLAGFGVVTTDFSLYSQVEKNCYINRTMRRASRVAAPVNWKRYGTPLLLSGQPSSRQSGDRHAKK